MKSTVKVEDLDPFFFSDVGGLLIQIEASLRSSRFTAGTHRKL